MTAKKNSPNHQNQNEFLPISVLASEMFLTEKQLAARWFASTKKLQADRLYGKGCQYIKIGRAVRYRLSDILAFEMENLRTSTMEL